MFNRSEIRESTRASGLVLSDVEIDVLATAAELQVERDGDLRPGRSVTLREIADRAGLTDGQTIAAANVLKRAGPDGRLIEQDRAAAVVGGAFRLSSVGQFPLERVPDPRLQVHPYLFPRREEDHELTLNRAPRIVTGERRDRERAIGENLLRVVASLLDPPVKPPIAFLPLPLEPVDLEAV